MTIARLYDIYEGKIIDVAVRQKGQDTERGDYVIVKNEEGQETMARFLRFFTVDDGYGVTSAEFLRKATAHDVQKIDALQEKSINALSIFQEKIQKYSCPMKPVSVQYSFNNKNIHFVFTAPERIDFRDLLKDLVATFKKKIYLEQIGPKDRAKLFGGFGKCGREQCCSTFLHTLPSVTMDAVRQQHLLYKSSSKLLGSCGKLLCCLTYELEVYKELSALVPPMGSIVQIGRQKGHIIGMDILSRTVRVQFDKTDKIEVVSVEKIKVLEEKKGEGPLLFETDEPLSYEETQSIS